jgi:type VI secretion system protein ImpH
LAGTAWTYLGHLSDYVIYDEEELEVEDELQRLVQVGYRYNFFQAVRIVEQSFPDAAPAGGQGPVSREVVRFRPALTLAYPTSDIRSIAVEGQLEDHAPSDLPRLVISCNFLGIYGASSPLPAFLTERLLDDEEEHPLPRRFLDLFNHRIYGLLYRIFRKYRPAAEPQAKPSGYFATRLAQLLALDTYDSSDPGESNAWLLGYADILAQRPVSVASMEAAIRRLLPDVAVRVEPCVPTWTAVPVDQLSRLGVGGSTLGSDCFLGRLVPNRSTTFRVSIGPVRYDRFLQLLPGGELHQRMAQLIDVLNRGDLDCEVELSTRAASVPPVRLGANHYNLGWNTRLFRRNADQDAIHRVSFPLHGQRHG